MPENNQMMSVQGQLVGMPLAGPESFSQQQLDYLKRALGMDETVLYSGESVLNPTLNEAPTNFEQLKIVYGANGQASSGNDIGLSMIEIPVSIINSYSDGSLFLSYFFSGQVTGKKPYYACGYYTGVNTTSWTCLWGGFHRVCETSWSNTTDWIRIHKIVGIHRIAGGN